jgi:hypothetical protein
MPAAADDVHYPMHRIAGRGDYALNRSVKGG